MTGKEAFRAVLSWLECRENYRIRLDNRRWQVRRAQTLRAHLIKKQKIGTDLDHRNEHSKTNRDRYNVGSSDLACDSLINPNFYVGDPDTLVPRGLAQILPGYSARAAVRCVKVLLNH